MKIHELKVWPRYFKAIVAGEKTFELRKLDRDFSVGDLIDLREYYNPHGAREGHFTGNKLTVRITYIMRGGEENPIRAGFAVLGIVKA